MLAISEATSIGFGRFIISSTTPFDRRDATDLGIDASSVLKKYVPEYMEEYEHRNWKMFQTLDRVYVNSLARDVLGWEPEFTFKNAINLLSSNKGYRSALSNYWRKGLS